MQKTERDHVKMISTPDDWPMWPTLPLKKPNSWDVGIILAYESCYSKQHGIVVWECSMFQVPTKEVKNEANSGTHTAVDFDKLREGRFQTYRDAYAVVKAGWQVD